MKTKINRKTYDTEAAQALAIYIKPDGEYFIHGSGGAMTHYAKRYKSRSNTSGEAIAPMTVDQAKDWTR